jgi:hypothetical protein
MFTNNWLDKVASVQELLVVENLIAFDQQKRKQGIKYPATNLSVTSQHSDMVINFDLLFSASYQLMTLDHPLPVFSCLSTKKIDAVTSHARRGIPGLCSSGRGRGGGHWGC